VRSNPGDLLLDDLPLGAKLGLGHVAVDDPELPGSLQAGFERLHAEALVPLAPVRLALLEPPLDELATGLLQSVVRVTGPEPTTELLLEDVRAHLSLKGEVGVDVPTYPRKACLQSFFGAPTF